MSCSRINYWRRITLPGREGEEEEKKNKKIERALTEGVKAGEVLEAEVIRDEHGNIKKQILDKMVDEIIDKNRLIYERLSEI
jgi:hypothetical protein